MAPTEGHTAAQKSGCSKITDYLQVVQERLENVVIEHKSFESVLKVYDGQSTLFYCDPPYRGMEKYYDSMFSEENHILLNSLLKGIKGRFILSYNDDDFIRNLYRDFKIESIERNNNLSGRYKSGNKRYAELLISNF